MFAVNILIMDRFRSVGTMFTSFIFLSMPSLMLFRIANVNRTQQSISLDFLRFNPLKYDVDCIDRITCFEGIGKVFRLISSKNGAGVRTNT